jgi:Rrf2 family protein
MLRLNAAARNGISLAVEVGSQDTESVLSLGEVARRTGISRRYLDKLAASLRAAALIVGHNGRRGGYRLARPATEITLAQIVEATSGPLNIVECVRHPERCERAPACPCRNVYQALNTRVIDTLASTPLSELIAAARQTPQRFWTCPPGLVRGEA